MKYIRPCFDIKDYGWLKFHCEVVGLDPVISALGTLPLILGEVNFYSFIMK